MKTFALALIATLSQSIKLRIMDTAADTAAGDTAASGGSDFIECGPPGSGSYVDEDGVCQIPAEMGSDYDPSQGPCGPDGWEGEDGSCQYADTAAGSGFGDMDCPPDGWLNEDGACEYPEYDYDCGPCGCDGWEDETGACQYPDTAAGFTSGGSSDGPMTGGTSGGPPAGGPPAGDTAGGPPAGGPPSGGSATGGASYDPS